MKDINNYPKTFFITYFAKSHNGEAIKNGGKFITRKASAQKPNGVLGRIFTDKNGIDRFIYWDFDAWNKKTKAFGNWRHATDTWTIKAI